MTRFTAASRVSAYLFLVILIFSVIAILCTVNTIVVHSSENGAIDLTGIDFQKDIVTIERFSFTVYSGAFYTSEDFAAGMVSQEGVRYRDEGESLGDHGTLRLELKLPPGEVYTITAGSVSYAQRLFINGKECALIGETGASIETISPMSKRYIEDFLSEGDITEIVIHYSAFVHADAGGLYSMELGLLRNVARAEQVKTFQGAANTATLLTAMLFFFGLFLFFPGSRSLLWFTLACGCIALRGLLTGDKTLMLLLPELNWYAAIRMEYLTTCGMALFSVLYVNSLFPGAASKWAVRMFVASCVAEIIFISVTQTFVFTRYAVIITGVCAAFGGYLLISIAVCALRKKLTSPLSGMERLVLLFGTGVYGALSIIGAWTHQTASLLLGLDYPQVGMTVFLFINILALTLGFSRTQRELDQALKNERELEKNNQLLTRLDRIKSNFLSDITHELKTPLAGISGLAQYTRAQLRQGLADGETDENLGEIIGESMRLAELVDRVLELSVEKEERASFSRVSIGSLFHRVRAVSAPILSRNENYMTVRADEDIAPLYGDEDMLLQVLLNLITNANRHSKGQEILLMATAKGTMAEIRIADRGDGIPKEILPFIFIRGESGDGGSGLGLAICKEVVESHGGAIDLLSEEGNGTSVWFTIPFAKEQSNEQKHDFTIRG